MISRGGGRQLDGGYAEEVVVGRAGGIDEEGVERRPILGELPLLGELRAFVEYLGCGPPPRSSAARSGGGGRTGGGGNRLGRGRRGRRADERASPDRRGTLPHRGSGWRR